MCKVSRLTHVNEHMWQLEYVVQCTQVDREYVPWLERFVTLNRSRFKLSRSSLPRRIGEKIVTLAGPSDLPVLVRSREPARKSGLLTEQVLEIHHFTDKLFSFKTARSPSFRFASGQFAMMGLMVDGKPLLRAYSITSGYYDDHLEFFSIKVPYGPLTSRLQHIALGDEVLVNPKATGTLLLGNLNPGRRLVLMATGTGFAPFASILRDPETFECFETVVIAYGCRQVAELEFATQTVVALHDHELLGPMTGDRLHYYAAVTREPYYRQGRITELITSGKLFASLKQAALDVATDRVMICGNPGMTKDLRQMLIQKGFSEGSSNHPAEFVIEKRLSAARLLRFLIESRMSTSSLFWRLLSEIPLTLFPEAL